MHDPPRPFAALLALTALLAACGAPIDPGPPQPTTFSGSVVTNGSPVLGAGLLLADPTSLGGSAIVPSAVVGVGSGLFVGPIAPVEDGDVAVILPDANDLPAQVLGPADEALLNLHGAVDCAVVADVPNASTTYFAVGYGSFPGPYVVSVRGGFMLAIATDTVIDFDDPAPLVGQTQYSWVHASEAVTLSIEGSGCATLVPVGMAGGVALDAGWNQVAWDVDGGLGVATLRAGDGTTNLLLNVDEAP